MHRRTGHGHNCLAKPPHAGHTLLWDDALYWVSPLLSGVEVETRQTILSSTYIVTGKPCSVVMGVIMLEVNSGPKRVNEELPS